MSSLPQSLGLANAAFELGVAQAMRAMADEVNKGMHVDAPDLQALAAALRTEVLRSAEAGRPISPQLSDVASLAETVASILMPLSQDICTVFAGTCSDDESSTAPSHVAL